MPTSIDFAAATSEQIENYLCKRMRAVRLSMNITQEQLARESGLSVGTIQRFEEGKKVSLNTFIRLLKALGLQQNLAILLPDPAVRPVERVRFDGRERQRARAERIEESPEPWTWGDESEETR